MASRGPHMKPKTLWNARLLSTVLACCVSCIAYSQILTPLVMPRFHDEGLSLADRIASTSFGDSQTYGVYADRWLKHGAFQMADGTPALKHMPGFPVVLALFETVFASINVFRIVQIVTFYTALYLFLVSTPADTPRTAITLTAPLLTFNPMLIKHFTAVMSDVLFSMFVLCVAFLLQRRDSDTRAFAYAGLAFGIAVYIRESALPMMLAVGLAYVAHNSRLYPKRVPVMVGVFFVVLAPWVIRNYAVSGRFILLTTKSSDLFYSSSIPLKTDVYRPFSNSDYDYANLYKTHSTAAVDDPIRRGVSNYVSHPKEQIVSMVIKTLALFDKPAVGRRPTQPGLSTARRIFDVGFLVVHVGLILLGAVLAFTPANQFLYLPYLIAAQYLQALFLWSEPRYLMPLYPFLIVNALVWYARQLNRWNDRTFRHARARGSFSPPDAVLRS